MLPLSQEFTIAFDNTGTGGTAKTRQENSYYAFGMIMQGSTVATPEIQIKTCTTAVANGRMIMVTNPIIIKLFTEIMTLL